MILAMNVSATLSLSEQGRACEWMIRTTSSMLKLKHIKRK
jgi:hypothetical protein